MRVSRGTIACVLEVGGALLSGIMLAAAFPPVGSAEFAWFGLIPLIVAARFSTPRRGFQLGFIAGAAFWLLSLSWLLSLGRTGTPLPVAATGWLLLSAYCSLYTAAFAMALSCLFQPRAGAEETSRAAPDALRGMAITAMSPLLWAGLEYLRSTLFTGFPWNCLGVSQYRNLAVAQLAAFGGVYAVSAVLVLLNTALAITGLSMADSFRRVRPARFFHVELAMGLLGFGLALMHGYRAVMRHRRCFEPAGIARIAAVQPNIPQLKKWPPQFARKSTCA